MSSPTSASAILLINKPVGPTSHDVVDRVRKLTGIRRVGHTGTLDPLASGLLIVLVGAATKRAAEFTKLPKTYRATVELGKVSETDDAEGPIKVIKRLEEMVELEEKVKEALESFQGEIEQFPPRYSAKKIAGRPAYTLARTGKRTNLKPQRVTIYSITPLEVSVPLVAFETTVSSGTYIRSLARDLGDRLGVGGYLAKLERIAIGPHRLEDAVPLDQLSSQNWEQLARPLP